MAKGTKKKSSSKKKAAATGTPSIIVAKGGLTQGKLAEEVLFAMEDDLRVSKKQGADFIASMKAVIERQLAEGQPVNLFGLVKIAPRLHTKGERMVNSEFGNPESPKVKKKYPAKVSVKVTALKPVKDALPSVQKMQKVVG